MIRCNFRAIKHLRFLAKSEGLFRLFFVGTSRLLCSIFCGLLNAAARLKERILCGIRPGIAAHMSGLELCRRLGCLGVLSTPLPPNSGGVLAQAASLRMSVPALRIDREPVYGLNASVNNEKKNMLLIPFSIGYV